MAHVVKHHFETNAIAMRMVRKEAGAAARAVGATEYDAGRVELAVCEAIANAHVHAYDGDPGPIVLEITYEPGRFSVAVHDDGPRTGPPFEPKFPEPPDPKVGNGFGLQIIKRVMDYASLEHYGANGHGTTVRMGIWLK
ncbi:MAG TPA: ATP-binding protein [bacterium]|nr:ATP-binding protein [bacterium]